MLVLVLKIAAISAAIFLAISLGLVFTQKPPAVADADGGSVSFAEAIAADYSTLPQPLSFAARDGTALAYRRYDGGTDRLLILVHGSAWHGMQFHKMASALAGRGLGTVIVPDMRGHGANPARRGDVDYVGQLEDDVADLIGHVNRDRAFGRIVLGGHSSGGGFVVRFAGGEHGAKADAFILMAPFLKYNAPTTRPNSGGWAQPATRRIIGLSMLNTVGITALDYLPVISFAMPRDVLDGPYGNTATTSYSFRMNTSFAPRSDYERDLAAITQPFMLIAGAQDEAFRADLYQEVIGAQAKNGEYVILPGVSHIGVTTDDAAVAAVGDWIARLPGR